MNTLKHLEHFPLIPAHLMAQISPLGQARTVARCGASGKVRNGADGLIWATEGRFFALTGLCWAFFVVNQTKAETPPRR